MRESDYGNYRKPARRLEAARCPATCPPGNAGLWVPGGIYRQVDAFGTALRHQRTQLRMTREQLITRFPHASEAFIRDNCVDDSRQPAVVELPPVGQRPAKDKSQARHPSKVRVRIIDVRRRLVDPDGLCPKYHIDCLRYAGLIYQDSQEAITLETSQRCCLAGEVPHTEISLEPI